MRRFALAAVALVAAAELAAAGDPMLPPTRTRALLRWLESAAYRTTWVGEPAVHPSVTTAHGLNVRTWYSPVLAADLAAGTLPFRRKAAMVKELYFGGTEEVVGWSVMRKVRAKSAAGRGWFFFETFDGERPIARGRGVGICVGCHRAGTDFLLSEFRPAP
jgi:hypothetical protein